ncbi:uncharacterized protein [Amphiura filiformis]|uniref:uncharacterized protein n=1 Tax=Amphiura filiformis TaxID=82378 RepID=UPI003B220DEB
MTQQFLQQAGKCFLQGKFNQCKTLLDNLPVIDIKRSVVLQLVQESNLLLCKEDASILTCDKNQVPSSAAVKQVLQKLRGLPASKKLLPLELALTYNEVMLSHLQGSTGQMAWDVKREIPELEKKLSSCLKRCRAALKLTKNSRHGDIEEQLKEISSVKLETGILNKDCTLKTTYTCDHDLQSNFRSGAGIHIVRAGIYILYMQQISYIVHQWIRPQHLALDRQPMEGINHQSE